MRLPVTLMLVLALPAALAAQAVDPTLRPRPSPSPQPVSAVQPGEMQVAPIECWWKTDRSAVSVGEHFQLTLTCAVLATDRVSVVVDESSLEPSALHLTPFEIVGGRRFRDVQNAPRKFFQYQYTMRILGEEFFGKEVPLPRLQITYRVQNSLQGGAALQGREAQYSLVPVPIRVLSLVPAGTVDIRDTPAETFGDVETRLFRSNILLMVAGVAFLAAGLMVAMLLARAAVRRRSSAAARPRTVSSMSVLGAAIRELAAVRTESARAGWTSELAGRAAAAVRLAGAVALSHPVSHKEVDRATPPAEGQVAAAAGLGMLRGKTTMLSAAVTPGSGGSNGHPHGGVAVPTSGRAAELWRALSQSLGVFTAARYARNGTLDGTALDSALADSEDAVKRLRVRQVLRFGRSKPGPERPGALQTWAR